MLLLQPRSLGVTEDPGITTRRSMISAAIICAPKAWMPFSFLVPLSPPWWMCPKARCTGPWGNAESSYRTRRSAGFSDSANTGSGSTRPACWGATLRMIRFRAVSIHGSSMANSATFFFRFTSQCSLSIWADAHERSSADFYTCATLDAGGYRPYLPGRDFHPARKRRSSLDTPPKYSEWGRTGARSAYGFDILISEEEGRSRQ